MTHANGFAAHGITHLSASSINHWLSCPGSFVVERLLGKKSLPGAAMWRGIAVEDAISAVIFGKATEQEATAAALDAFDKKTAMLMTDCSKERDVIPGMVKHGLEALSGYGDPIAAPEDLKQHKVVLRCGLEDGTSIDVIGFLDFAFGGNRKAIVDLKTTNRIPSTQSFAHRIQRAIYQRAAADGWTVEFLYVSSKKSAVLADGDIDETLRAVKATANRINRFLSLSPDPQELARIVPVNPESFFWNDMGMRDVRREVFGF